MKNLSPFKKVNLLTLTSIASFMFLFSCSEDSHEEDIINLNATNTSQSSSSSVKLNIPNGNMTASNTKSGYDAANANDDNYSTKWRADGTSMNLIADLGTTKPVDFVKVSHSSGTSRVYSFQIWTRETSSSSWVNHGNYTSPGNSSSTIEYDFNNVNARFVRLKCNGNNVNNRNEVKKFEVWGTNTSTSSSSNNTPSNDSSSTSISTNDGVFELDGYNIESSSHLSSTTDKKTTTKGTDDFSTFGDYYILSGSNGDYYLKSAPKDGKRTEFKESNERSLNDNKTLKYEAEVTDIPEHGVTISQVHNRGGVSRPYIRVYIEDGHILIKETTNDLSNSSGQYKTYPEDDVNGNTDEIRYVSGSKFKVQMEMGDGKVNIKIETTTDSYEVDLTPSVLPSTYKDDFYFKAGVYTEGNDTEPVIQFYSFEE